MLSIVATPALAGADEPTRPLDEAIRPEPSRCLDAKRIADHASVWLQRRDIDRRLSIDVADVPDGVRFVVRLDGAVLGERTLDVKRVPCEEIHAALGLGIAAAIDATVLPSLGVASPAPPPPPAPPPSPPPAPPAVTRPEAHARVFVPEERPVQPIAARKGWSPSFGIALHGLVLADVLPKVTVGVSPSAELTIVPAFDLRAAAIATGTTSIAIGNGSADVGLVGGLLDACAAMVVVRVVRLRGCGGVVAGVVSASGSGFTSSRSATAAWVAPRVRADGRWSVTRVFGVVLGVDGFFPGLKPSLQVLDEKRQVVATHTFPLAGVGASLGPSLVF